MRLVNCLVALKRISAPETFLTLRTLELFVGGVNALVSFQMLALLDRLVSVRRSQGCVGHPTLPNCLLQ